ncbi:hypothetical protein HMH01_17160 [Halovulum dunhuangense]|uniref:Uncharacterized protein n=1 Tax=Halovulum dunhuangense TaxID=1505036 RepID=A0A849L6V5_9RHOB|nr:hypothetical protein [Halovulum dunhuangense]NNU82169.1 hypothetical protein [Halovulum dunhuangense]
MEKLRALWMGNLPLSEAFWGWTVVGGLLVNVSTSVVFLILLTYDQPLPALAVGYGLSLPFNLMVVVGVWRSAARYDGPPLHATLARGVSVALMSVLSLT